MASDEITYSFKEVFDERMTRLNSDIAEIKRDISELQKGQKSQGEEVASLKAKMIVYGSGAIILGTVIANALSKVWNQ